jgi:pimeloyl-ACP methyl ester carboxylesterase
MPETKSLMKTYLTRSFGRRCAVTAGAFISLALLDASAIAGQLKNRGTAKGAERLTQSASMPRPDALPSDREIPLLAELRAAFEAMPMKTERFTTSRSGYAVDLAMHQAGSGTKDAVVVFIHGVLANSQTWIYLAGELGRDHDAWLIDLPGCGESDKPGADKIEPDGYSPTAMAERILQTLQSALAVRAQAGHSPKRLVLVGHSLGGTVVIRMLSSVDLQARYADVLKHVDGATLIAPCDFAVHAEMPVFTQVIELKSWQAAVGEALGVVKIMTDRATRDGYHVPQRATRESAELLRFALTDGPSRRAAQAMLRQAVPWRIKQRRPDWPAIRQLRDEYKNVRVPVHILWGEWDEALPASMGHILKDEIPGATLRKLTECGHSLPSERPMECAGVIREFEVALNARSIFNVAEIGKKEDRNPFAPTNPKPDNER